MEQNKSQNLTYEQALNELEKIVNEIEQGNISVDQLAEKVKKAKVLFEFCMNKLSSIEENVADILGKTSNSLNQNTQNQ